MTKFEKILGYKGHITIRENRIIEARGVEDAETLKDIIITNIEKGNRDAKELGFNKLRGFIMFGEESSLVFMKDTALIVDTKKTDWQNVFTTYTYYKSWCVGGIVSLLLSFIFFYIVLFTNILNWLAPEPRFYIPTILLIIGIFGLSVAKTKLAYRLD